MIVAQLENTLILLVQARRVAVGQAPAQFRHLLVVLNEIAGIKFLQVTLRQLQQRRENDAGRCAGSVEVTIHDGSVDAGTVAS